MIAERSYGFVISIFQVRFTFRCIDNDAFSQNLNQKNQNFLCLRVMRVNQCTHCRLKIFSAFSRTSLRPCVLLIRFHLISDPFFDLAFVPSTCIRIALLSVRVFWAAFDVASHHFARALCLSLRCATRSLILRVTVFTRQARN